MGAYQSNEAVAPEGSGPCYGMWGTPRGTEHSAEHDATDSPFTQSVPKEKKNLSVSFAQKHQNELNRCQNTFHEIEAWINEQKEQEECIRTTDYEKLLEKLEQIKNQIAEHLEILKDAVKREDPRWENHVKNLDKLFGNAHQCNDDLNRRSRLEKQHSIKSERVKKDFLAVGINAISPSGDVVLRTFPDSGSSDSEPLEPNGDFMDDEKLAQILKEKNVEELSKLAQSDPAIMNLFKEVVEIDINQEKGSESESESVDKVLDRDKDKNLNVGGRKEIMEKRDPGLKPKQPTSPGEEESQPKPPKRFDMKKYQKMKKMGLPEASIRHKIRNEGFKEVLYDVFIDPKPGVSLSEHIHPVKETREEDMVAPRRRNFLDSIKNTKLKKAEERKGSDSSPIKRRKESAHDQVMNMVQSRREFIEGSPDNFDDDDDHSWDSDDTPKVIG